MEQITRKILIQDLEAILRVVVNKIYVKCLHTLGYGEKHDADLMQKLSLIRDGGYFFIRYLSAVNSAILEIYGSLSTNFKVNLEVEITSNYKIEKVMGMDDMYESKLISNTQSTFTTKLQ